MSDGDLSGSWTGRYSYDVPGTPPVAFTVELTDVAGLLNGDLTEPNTFREDAGPTLHAEIVGERSDGVVTFRKVYLGFSQGGDPFYHGLVSEGGDLIEGSWFFPTDPGWRGTFRMIRAGRARAACARDHATVAD